MRNAKILVIDDESKYRDAVKKGLEAEGHRVVIAVDGEEGLAKAREHNPDLIICDMRMPKMDGFDVLKSLRGEANMNTPFIMLTAVDDFEKIKRAYEYEANFYVTKPAVPAKLFKATDFSKNVRVLLSFPRTAEGDK